MRQIEDNVFMIEHGQGDGSFLHLYERDQSFGSGVVTSPSAIKHIQWGILDNQPNTLSKLATKNGQVLATLDTLRDFVFGKGIVFRKKVIEGDKLVGSYRYHNDRLEDLFGEHKINQVFLKAIVEHNTNGNVFFKHELDTRRNEYKLGVSDCFFTRIRLKEDGTREYVWNPNFGNTGLVSTNHTKPMPIFDPYNPGANILSIEHQSLPRSGNPFYSYPAWWATETHIELANLIPLFHKSGLNNGYNIKYLIKMPKDYFDKEGGKELTSKEIAAKWKDWSEKMKKFLSGTDNVDKTMISRYIRDDAGKPLPAIEIEPIKNLMTDDAYAKVSELGSLSIANAGGILPTLAGISSGKGNDSGSQIRVMSDYQQHFRTSAVREILLSPIKTWLRQNGFDRTIFPDIEATTITTLDVTKQGTQPTTDNPRS